MPRPPEPRTNCDGCGCAQDGCDSCWGESDDQYYLPYKPEPPRFDRYGRKLGVIDCDGCGCGNRQCETCKGFRELWDDFDEEDDEEEEEDADVDDSDHALESWREKRRLEDPPGLNSRRDSGCKRRRVAHGDDYDEEEQGEEAEEEGEEEEYDEDNYDEDLHGREDYGEEQIDEEEGEEEEFEDGAAGEPSFKDMVNALSEQTARDTLVRLASMAPSAQVAIRQAYARQTEESAQRPVDWDFLSKKVWHLLYTSREAELYRTASEERRAQLVRRIWDQIVKHVESMCKSGRRPFASKLSALATVRKILKSILLGGPGSLAGAVRDGLRAPLRINWSSVDSQTDWGRLGGQTLMFAIRLALAHMTREEKIRAGGTYDEKGTLLSKYIWCRDEAQKLGLESLKELDQVLVELAGHAEW